VFSSVREGDTRSLIERDIELWNARDREGWMAGRDLHRLEIQAPGGPRLTGREAAETIWNMYNEAFPDNRLDIIAIHADDRGGVHEGRATGTHTGTLRGPAGEIAATGRSADMRFCGVYEIDEGKITSFHLYFDQAELMSQLGLAAGSTPRGMLPTDRPGGPGTPTSQARPAHSQTTSPVACKEGISDGTVHVPGRLYRRVDGGSDQGATGPHRGGQASARGHGGQDPGRWLPVR
jgi:limonene-1,2-epoxide hydrolase